jgi:L-iditol 2-dehydrogenase
MAWPERLLVELPTQIPDLEASLLEPLGVALHAIDLADLRPGMRAAVIGTGPIGLLLIRALRAMGIDEVVATDLLRHRVEAARASGARQAWLAGTGEPGPISAFDAAFECAGTDEALATSLRLTRAGGRVILVGIPGSDRTSFQASEGRRKGLTLVFCRRMRAEDLSRAVDMVVAGTLELNGLVTDVFPLSQGAAAFQALATRRGLKVVVRPEHEA